MSKLKDNHPLKDLEKKRGDCEISIPSYIRHYVHPVEDGHDIVIVSGETHNERLMKIKCRWPEGKNPRTKPFTSNRIYNT